MPDRHKILADLKDHLRQNYKGFVKDVILFGSQAKNKATNDSDYDILVVLENDYTSKDEIEIMDLCYDINLKYDILIDVKVLSTREFNSIRGKQPIFVNALRTGIYA